MSSKSNYEKNLRSARMKRFFSDNAIFLVWIIFFAYSLLFIEGFASAYNIRNYFSNCAPLMIVATGLSIVVLNGGIDFSTTSIISLVSTICAYILVKTPLAGSVWAIVVAVIVGILIGVIIGAINGLAVAKLKMPSFVATLSTKLIFSGVAVWFGSVYYDKISLSGLPEGFTAIGGKGGPYWIPLLIAFAVFILAEWLLIKTLFGRRVYAIGVNPNSAKVSGIPVRKTIFMEFLLCGLLAGLAGLVFTAKNRAGITTMGDDMFINIIGSVVIGGTSPAGGFGSVKKTLYGVLFLTLLSTMLNLLGVPHTLYDVVKGVFVLIAASLELVTRQMNIRAAAKAVKA